MYKGIDWDNRRSFLLGLIKENAKKLELVQAVFPRGWNYTVLYYNLNDLGYINQRRLAERFGVPQPVISAKIATIICYLGCDGDWSETTQKNADALKRRIAQYLNPISDNERSSERRTRSERLRAEFGWSDIDETISEADVELTRHLYDLSEKGLLDVVKGIHNRSYEVLKLRHGLDPAGWFRTFAEVADLLGVSMSVVQADYQRALRVLKSPRFKRASERTKKQA